MTIPTPLTLTREGVTRPPSIIWDPSFSVSSKFTFLDCFTDDFSIFAFFPVPENIGIGIILHMNTDNTFFKRIDKEWKIQDTAMIVDV